MHKIKQLLITIILISLLNNNLNAQNNTAAAAVAAGGVAALGLGILSSKLAINEIEDQQEAEMLEWLIENNEIFIPSEFELGTIGWNFNSYTDIYRANILAFYLHQKDSPSYVYLRIVGNEKYVNKYGTIMVKGSILKYNKIQWGNLILELFKHIDNQNSNDYKSVDSIFARTKDIREHEWINLEYLEKFNEKGIVYLEPKERRYWWEVYFKNNEIKLDDHHTVFFVNSGLLSNQPCIADFSEKEFLLYIPDVQQTAMFKPEDLVRIYKSFKR